MPIYMFAAPLLPGKTESWKNYLKEFTGARRDDHRKSRQRHGIKAERVWLQRTPNGDMVVVRIEADNPQEALERMKNSNDPFDTWFREKILIESHGINPSDSFPSNEQILGYQGQTMGPNSYGFVMPIPPGKTETLKRYFNEMKEKRYDDLRKRNQKIGLHAVQVWLQKTPNGDFAVVRWDTDNPQKIFDYMYKSEEPFDVWFREKILSESFGRDLSGPPPPINEQIHNYIGQAVQEKAPTGTRNR